MSKKIVFTALACILLGVLLILAAGFLTDFHYEQASAGNVVTQKTQQIDEPFSALSVETDSYDIRILPAADGKCTVVSAESETISCTAQVRGGTLLISCRDNSPWYEHISFSVSAAADDTLTVYLPRQDYTELTAVAVSGEIRAADLTAERAAFETTSGEIELTGIQAKTLTVRSVSGDQELERCRCDELRAESTSGSMELDTCTAANEAQLQTVSGEIELRHMSAGAYTINTTSGDVEGTITEAKNFLVSTTSGEVRVPASVPDAGDCRITTTSGDIEIKLD